MIQGSADHFVTDLLGHRQRFTSNHRFVHVTGPFLQSTIDWDPLSGTDVQKVASLDVSQSDGSLLTILNQASRSGNKVQQLSNGVTCAVA